MGIRALNPEEIKAEIKKRADLIGASEDLFPTFGIPRQDATPCIQINKKGYHLVIVERGKEFERKTTKDIDELLFLVFEDITFSIASKFELHNRIENEDSRRQLFNKQLELLSKISKEWFEREKEKQEELLERFPFSDGNKL